MKVILAIKNNEIEEKIKAKEEIKVEDTGDNLYELLDCISVIDKVDYLIIERALDRGNDVLINIAMAAQRKNIKLIILTNDFKSLGAKKLINYLVVEEVYAFMDINNFNVDDLLNILKDYPNEFDFRLIAEPNIRIIEKERIVEKEKIVRSQIITCFSNDDSFASANMSVMLAHMVSKVTELKCLLMDFNTFTPILDHFLGVEPYLDVNTKYDLEKQTSLGAMINAIERGNLTNEIFKELVIRSKKIKFDFVSGLYDSIKDEKVNIETYDKLIEKASKVYDVIIINTNPYLRSEATYSSFIKATKIIGITNGNFTAIRNILSVFNLMTNVVSKESMGIVVNNIGEYSLNVELLQKAISDDDGYNILGYIPYDERVEKALNSDERYYDAMTKEVQECYNRIMANLGYKVEQKKKKFFFLGRS